MSVSTTFQLPQQDEKPAYVQRLFQRVARYYDLMNDCMTFGLHRLWKREVCRRLNPAQARPQLLDVCCGTGDITLYLKQHYPQGTVIGLDFCSEMLAIAQIRLQKANIMTELIQGDALALPFEDNCFDGVTIGYGLRNVADYTQCLRELYRVVKPGGQVVILDMSYPGGVFKLFSAFYRFQLLPLLGKLIAKDANAYKYLSHSIFFYLTQEELKTQLAQVGFQQVGYKNLLGGICAQHWGYKP